MNKDIKFQQALVKIVGVFNYDANNHIQTFIENGYDTQVNTTLKLFISLLLTAVNAVDTLPLFASASMSTAKKFPLNKRILHLA